MRAHVNINNNAAVLAHQKKGRRLRSTLCISPSTSRGIGEGTRESDLRCVFAFYIIYGHVLLHS